jgi:hypothetical protein
MDLTAWLLCLLATLTAVQIWYTNELIKQVRKNEYTPEDHKKRIFESMIEKWKGEADRFLHIKQIPKTQAALGVVLDAIWYGYSCRV